MGLNRNKIKKKCLKSTLKRFNNHVEDMYKAYKGDENIRFYRLCYKYAFSRDSLKNKVYKKWDYKDTYKLFSKIIRRLNYFMLLHYTDYTDYKGKNDDMYDIITSELFKRSVYISKKYSNHIYDRLVVGENTYDKYRKELNKKVVDKKYNSYNNYLKYISVPEYHYNRLYFNVMFYNMPLLDKKTQLSLIHHDLIRKYYFSFVKHPSDLIKTLDMLTNKDYPYEIKSINSKEEYDKIIKNYFIPKIRANNKYNRGRKKYYYSK